MPAPPARSRARLLARHGRASPALVCPLVLVQAAEIEALPVEQFLTDATKLANGLRALHQAFGNDVIVTASADDLAAAAAGDLAAAAAGAGSPAAHPRVAAAVEATRRLAVTADDAALAVALCGPAGLAAQLGQSPADHAVLETCGAVLLALAKAFLEAGANLLLLVEAEPLPRRRPTAGARRSPRWSTSPVSIRPRPRSCWPTPRARRSRRAGRWCACRRRRPALARGSR